MMTIITVLSVYMVVFALSALLAQTFIKWFVVPVCKMSGLKVPYVFECVIEWGTFTIMFIGVLFIVKTLFITMQLAFSAAVSS